MEHRDLNDMAVFSAIAQVGSISGAANKLKLPKSNVSRRLARLEERLGVQLLERNTRSSRLTSIGVCYADHCRSMVEEADAADAVIETNLAEPSGELRISASVLVGQQIIAPAIAAYTKQFPNVHVILELTNAQVNLIEDGFDLAFRIGKNKDSSLVTQSITKLPRNLYASEQYLSQSSEVKKPQDLLNQRCLTMSDEANASCWILNRGDQSIEVSTPFSISINDFLTLRKLATEGAGIAMLPSYAVHTECSLGLLSPVLPEWHGSYATLTTIYPSRRGATSKLRAFIECVRSVVDYLAPPSSTAAL